ncbi:MAG: hypothetical protein ACRD0K_06200 [Egibacteraceae bacterium]
MTSYTDAGQDRRRLTLRQAANRIVARPHQAMVAFACIPIGIAATVLGPRVSLSVTRAFGTFAPVINVWGVLLAAGGLCMAAGIVTHRSAVERAGCGMLGPAMLLYSLAVYAALGIGGTVAGTLTLALGLASSLKSYDLTRRAKLVTGAHGGPKVREAAGHGH